MSDDMTRHLLDRAQEELDLLREVLLTNDVLDDQWTPAPGRPRSLADAGQPRAPHSGVKRPTEDITLDPRRLELRRVVLKALPALKEAVITIRGTRRAVEIAHERWQGE